MSKKTREAFDAAMSTMRAHVGAEVSASRFTDDNGRPYLYGTMRVTRPCEAAPPVVAQLAELACAHGAYLTMNVYSGVASIQLAVTRWLDERDEPGIRSFVCATCGVGLSQHRLEACAPAAEVPA